MKKQSYLEQELPFVDRKDQSKAETEDEDTEEIQLVERKDQSKAEIKDEDRTFKKFTFDRQVAFRIFASYAAYISVVGC